MVMVRRDLILHLPVVPAPRYWLVWNPLRLLRFTYRLIAMLRCIPVVVHTSLVKVIPVMTAFPIKYCLTFNLLCNGMFLTREEVSVLTILMYILPEAK